MNRRAANKLVGRAVPAQHRRNHILLDQAGKIVGFGKLDFVLPGIGVPHDIVPLKIGKRRIDGFPFGRMFQHRHIGEGAEGNVVDAGIAPRFGGRISFPQIDAEGDIGDILQR